MFSIAEFVLPGHPDKLCDRIADRLVDEACARDPLSLVGIEVALHQEIVLVTGCITTVPVMNKEEVTAIVCSVFQEAGYNREWLDPSSLKIELDLRLEELDDELRHLRGISDDQAICVGFAGGSREDRYLPRAHRLAYLAGQHMIELRKERGLGPDGKVIVSCNRDEISQISFSLHHHETMDRRELFELAFEVSERLEFFEFEKIVVNGGGDFTVGGPWGDNGLSGKKLVMDAYGPMIPIGGGAWSGKDPHKIDRVGGLFARYLALRAVRLGLGKEARVSFGWHPGGSEPSLQILEIDGKQRDIRILGRFDTSIEGIWQSLGLGSVRFADYADGSWFQKSAPWDLRDVLEETGSFQEAV